MAVKIADMGACLYIEDKGAVTYISKSHIKRVEAVKEDTLMLETGNSSQHNIFLYFPEITEPAVETVQKLALQIARMLPAGGSGGGGMTDIRLVEIFKELNRIREVNIRLLDIVTVGWWRDSQEAVKIDDTQPGFIYKGYCDGARLEGADNVWAIQRIKNDQGIITNEWPDGTNAGVYRWDDRYSLNYKPRYL